MLVTATTVLDTPANVRRFVTDNLAMGVDHLVVFLDAPGAPGQQEVRTYLADHPHTTCIPGDRTWWHGRRPDRLNVRQRINANVVLALLEDVAEVDWVVHIDGDEVVAADHQALAEVPLATGALWLAPWEAVSRLSAPERPTAFKPLLGEDDLQLLATLGVVEAATNQAYFHGHVLGKSGVRPSSGLRLTLHHAVSPSGEAVSRTQRHEDPLLRVLHYDAVSGEEFVRKWRTMSAAGPVAVRPDRAPLARALHRLVERDLPDPVAEKYFTLLYQRTTEDTVSTLEELGMLEHLDPTEGTHRPRAFSAAARSRVGERLEELRAAPKMPFHVNHGAGAAAPAAAGHGGPRARLRRWVPGS